MIIIGFEKLEIMPDYQKNDDGFLSFELPNNIPEDKNSKMQVLLECMIEEFMDIQKNYSKYVKVNEI